MNFLDFIVLPRSDNNRILTMYKHTCIFSHSMLLFFHSVWLFIVIYLLYPYTYHIRITFITISASVVGLLLASTNKRISLAVFPDSAKSYWIERSPPFADMELHPDKWTTNRSEHPPRSSGEYAKTNGIRIVRWPGRIRQCGKSPNVYLTAAFDLIYIYT